MKQKLKTHSGASKRFKITGTGKLMCQHAGKRHLLTHKSSKRTRTMGARISLFKGEVASIKLLLPNG
ncbi:MAG: 50S ribosomal protein L35 [Nitrospirae bacterium]|nr:50S ribosomal protein L35 [Candidatus Troglogloeales bacterium]MBI3598640.1 50S ribosomal protein L35 [Candidatus Troglogloeales bacterium]